MGCCEKPSESDFYDSIDGVDERQQREYFQYNDHYIFFHKSTESHLEYKCW